MKELKACPAPIENHCCKAMEHCETTSISKRHINGKDRWMWEQTQKDGQIAANEIMFCPYCGVDLNRRAEPENASKIVKKLWELYDKYEDVEHVVCGDAAKRLSAEPKNKALTLEQLKNMNVPCPLWVENAKSGDMTVSRIEPVLFNGICYGKEERACWVTSNAHRANTRVEHITSGKINFYVRNPEGSIV